MADQMNLAREIRQREQQQKQLEQNKQFAASMLERLRAQLVTKVEVH